MSNMSYCRFENTFRDLDDCKDALEDLLGNDETVEPLSRSELSYAKQLAAMCLELAMLVAEYSELLIDDACDDPLEKLGVAIDHANEIATKEADDRREARREERRNK